MSLEQFHANSNYGQEVTDRSNLGQPGNKVYLTVAAGLTKTIADITFGKGVLAVGFDLKDSGNKATTGSQGFLAYLFSGSTSPGAFPFTSPARGTSFQSAGSTSSSQINRISRAYGS